MRKKVLYYMNNRRRTNKNTAESHCIKEKQKIHITGLLKTRLVKCTDTEAIYINIELLQAKFVLTDECTTFHLLF